MSALRVLAAWMLLLLAGGAIAQRIDSAVQTARDGDRLTILQAELAKERGEHDAALLREDVRAAEDHERNAQAIANEIRRVGATPSAAKPAPAAPKRVAMTELERKLHSPLTTMRTQQTAAATP